MGAFPLSVRYHGMDEEKRWKNGVVYVPGEAFYHDKPDTRTLRLSYSTVSEAGLLTAVERLAASL